MNYKKKANILIEEFYQNAPEIMGSGRAYEFGVKLAKLVVKEILEDLPPTLLPDRTEFWNNVMCELETKS